MVVMETLKYTCVPSFTSMHCMVCKLRSEEVVTGKVPEAIFVNGCHGNAQIHMCTKFHFHASHGL